MWLDAVPPVLQPGMGSVAIRDGELGAALGRLLDPEVRGRLRREAAEQFQPGEGGECAVQLKLTTCW